MVTTYRDLRQVHMLTVMGRICLLMAGLLALCEGRKFCSEKALERREEEANVVMTGTVKDLYRDPEHPYMMKGEVEVKRVFKGENVISHLPEMPAVHHHHHHRQFDNHINAIPGFHSFKKMVMVDGFGDPHICNSAVRKHDTRIFLLSRGSNGELKLNSSIVRLTLNNLEAAESAVKDVPFVPRPTAPTAPCERRYCAFGAQCVESTVTGDGQCRCLEKCTTIFAPVCGSDNVTYTSECELRLASCRLQERIAKKWQGTCDVMDPCKEKECSFGAQCVPSLDGLIARCQCPERCDSYGDSEGSTPVCGTDGKDYANQCEMKRAACREMRDVRAKYLGKCDPCDGFQCPSSEVCQLDDKRKPVCRCNSLCTLEFAPVCGTDGRTYSNECIMRTEACKDRKEIRIMFRGECSSGNNPCHNKSCGVGEECHVDRQGNARCTCPSRCEPVLRPVCGSNGVTYDNECELRRQSCLNKLEVTIEFFGQCSVSGPCFNHRCNYGALCVERHGHPVCECPTCSEEFKPVCGSNGISYTNECKLKAESCEKRKIISIRKQGMCDGCESKVCDHYAICESDGKGGGRCVCPPSCVQVEEKICGTDGVTYQNECELRVASCAKQQFIMIASHGDCDRCVNVRCRFGARCEDGKCMCPQDCPDNNEPVCANDGQTYLNECEMRRQSCALGQELDALHSGECDELLSGSGDGSGMEVCDETTCRFGGTCEYDAEGSHGCVCNFNCEAIRAPVCGSDGKTYGNDCQMREESCRKQIEITPQDMDNCEDIDEELCDGAAPLINPSTSREYNCDNGRDTCPAGSYCHRLAGVAKCCKEDQPIRSCSDTRYGCCPDGKTSAPGSNDAGCPSLCRCHPLGSFSQTCDPRSGQCVCKPGVGGERCDRCEPGAWGLPKIAEGVMGCTPCGCDHRGSVRDDCEQMTGRCSCKPGVTGQKCNLCENGREIGPHGCEVTAPVTSCAELTCRFGRVCQMENGLAVCVCPSNCPPGTELESVCGSDGVTYGSRCQLRQFACRLQKEIEVDYIGTCTGLSGRTTTSLPGSRPRKTTRHLSGKVTKHTLPPTPSSAEYGYIGDFCMSDKECVVENSYCKSGLCSCVNGFSSSQDTRACRELGSEESDACNSRPCLNGGHCQSDDELGFRCFCPLGLGGRHCDIDLLNITTLTPDIAPIEALTEAPSLLSSTLSDQGDLFGFISDSPDNKANSFVNESFLVPSFDGKSYLQFRRLHRANREVTLEFEFKTLNYDGILMYSGQSDDGTGDFISVAVKDGYVEFRFDLGSGPAILKTPERVQLNVFHKITARRFGKDGTLQMDEGEEVSLSALGNLKSLNLGTPLYLGFVPDAPKEVFTNIGVENGLVGCVESLKVESKDSMHEYDLMYPGSRDITAGLGIGECGQNPCNSLPCKNGGTCFKVDDEDYECKCLPGWAGSTCAVQESVQPCNPNPCQGGGTCMVLPDGNFVCRCPPGRLGDRCNKGIAKDITVPEFNGNSYMELKLTKRVARTMEFEIWFLAKEPNGALLYGSSGDPTKNDFISLNLVDGYLQFRFDLGSGIANITSPSRIPLNVWHRVGIGRTNRHGTMSINGDNPIKGHSKGILKELNLRDTVYLGGFPGSVTPMSGIQRGLVGAIQRVNEGNTKIESLVGTAVLVVDIIQYNGLPCPKIGGPCQNGGTCIPQLNEYECKCSPEFTGKLCDKGKGQKSRKLREGATEGKRRGRKRNRQNEQELEQEETAAGSIDSNLPVAFDGRTFLRYNNKIARKQRSQKTNNYEVYFRTTAMNGLIMLEHKTSTIHGDYLAIAVNGGHLEVSYNLGKQSSEEGLHTITSTIRVNDGKWHTIAFNRESRKGVLTIDGASPIMDVSVQGATMLDTDGNLWIGGTRHLPAGLPSEYSVGFRGCIDYVRIDGVTLDLVEDRTSHGSVEHCYT